MIGSDFSDYFTDPGKTEISPEEKVDNQISQEDSGLKKLIVDDNETSLQLISIMVQKFSKELFQAQNGIEAV